jgi:nucleoside-diphosphate-sugar epimerase
VCNNESCEFGELIEMARRLLDSKSKITNIPEKKFHASVQVKNMHMDSTKLYRLGYKQRYGVNDTILELTGVVDNA